MSTELRVRAGIDQSRFAYNTLTNKNRHNTQEKLNTSERELETARAEIKTLRRKLAFPPPSEEARTANAPEAAAPASSTAAAPAAKSSLNSPRPPEATPKTVSSATVMRPSRDAAVIPSVEKFRSIRDSTTKKLAHRAQDAPPRSSEGIHREGGEVKDVSLRNRTAVSGEGPQGGVNVGREEGADADADGGDVGDKVWS